MSQSPQINPLTQPHLDKLNGILETVPLTLELAKACKECGIPTDEYIAQLEMQRDQARRLKAMFFPTEP